jgi:two-component system, NarL family, nitrate/nitrite response regulator NarL
MQTRVLLVDDSVEFIETARRLLEREGLPVVGTATNGAEAVRLAEELRPDLVLVDIDLGGESGFDVVRRILNGRRDHRRRAILISSHSPEDFADLVAESPAEGFISKSGLSARAIREILERG